MIKITAISYSAGSEQRVSIGESLLIYWKSPSTADSTNTVVLPTLTGRSIVLWGCWDTTTGDAVTHTLSTATVLIDDAGGTTDHTYVLCWGYA